jgi:FkbM family methyltransferase
MFCATGSAYATGDYEERIARVMLRVVKSGWICVDVGAHQGYFTLLLSRLVGEDGQVIAFEAHPENASLIRRNVDLNGFQRRVRVENWAIADGVQSSMMLYAGRTEDSSTEWNVMGHDVSGCAARPMFQIPTISLDRYFQEGPSPDFVKMDIEGAEGLALVGMRSLLRQQQPVVLVEFHNAMTWAARVELLAAGYDLWALEDGQQKLKAPDDETRAYYCLAMPRTWTA